MITTEYYSQSRHPHFNDAVGEYVSQICFGHADGFEKFSSMAVIEDGELIGGTVFHNWDEGSGVMELSSAAESSRWLMPKAIQAMMAFPFDMMGCQMVVLRISERNKTMASIAKRFGFEGVLIPRLRGRDESEWIFTLTAESWRDHPVYKRGIKR